MKFKVVLWGIGKIYNRLLNTLRFFEIKGEIEIVALTADKIPAILRLDGYPVIPKEELAHLGYDLVIIMNDVHEKDIYKTAVSCGVPEEKILFYRVLELPFFQFEKYMRLKKSRLSIVSNNCWGGTIYNTLGMECLSPFKNLFLEDEDYIRLLKNLQYYLSRELEFREFAIDIHSGAEYPVMCLEDVLVHCNHAEMPEDAAADWQRRVAKINWSNIFVEMYTENIIYAKEFSKLNAYKKKVCFVPFEEDNECLMQLTALGNEHEFYEVVNRNAGNGNGSLTYLSWELLEGKREYRYER